MVVRLAEEEWILKDGYARDNKAEIPNNNTNNVSLASIFPRAFHVLTSKSFTKEG